MTLRIELADLSLPDFGLPTVEPTIPAATYESRIVRAQVRAAHASMDALLVYGDREHFANLAYLTGYDPRFEEALLILVPGRFPTLLVGNEGMPYSSISPVFMERVLYQTFSLPSMPRSQSAPFKTILHDAGIDPMKTRRVGFAGWKYFTSVESTTPLEWLEVPAYMVDTLRDLGCEVVNASGLFMEPEHGLRAVNEVDQLAYFEFSATTSSQAMRDVIFGVRPGMTEFQAAQLMKMNGIPQSAHPLLFSGERTALGLPSPSSRVLKKGDPIFGNLALWGSNTARGGFLVESADELPAGIQDYVEKLVAPYFAAIVEWYAHVGIGVEGGELYDIIHRRLGDPFFGVLLNPGHLIHLDEWISSPIYQGADLRLRSGVAMQVDVIPATNSPYFTTNIEDGIALADGALRAEFAQKYPEAWERIQHRRHFMQEVLGIPIKPEVLPFSNLPAYLPPFWLAPHKAMRVAR